MPTRLRSAMAAGSDDPTIRTQLPGTIPITADEIKVLDQLLGGEIARLFEGDKHEEI